MLLLLLSILIILLIILILCNLPVKVLFIILGVSLLIVLKLFLWAIKYLGKY